MPIANDMKHIAEGIEVSHGERAAFLSDLSKGTNETLKTFHREHQKMSTDLWDFLSSDQNNREKVVASLLGKNKRELKAMAEKLAEFLKESTSATKKETAALMGQIREFIDLVEKENSELKKETGNLLSSFHSSRQAMAEEQRNALSSETKGRVGKVKEMLAAFDGEHKTRSNQLRRNLADFQKDLESTVKEMRAPVIRDLKQTRQNWQNLVRIMAAKRDTSRYPSGYRRAGKAVTPAKKIEGAPKEEVAEATTIIGDVVSAVKLKEQMMRLISAAASGVSLVQMAKTLGIPYIRLAKPTKELVRQGEIIKRDAKYFEA